MTRDELRTGIGRIINTAQESVDSWEDPPAVDLDAIMALVDTYSVAIVQGVTPSYLPRPTEQEVLAWLKARK